MVGWERRGAVTGGVVFFRIAGGAIGTAVFAAVANASLLSSGAVASVDEVGGALDLAAGEAVRAALAAAVHHVFLTMIVVAVLGVLAVLVMPSRRETAEGGGEAGDVVPAD